MEQTIIARKNESEGNVSVGTKKRRNISVNEDVYIRLLKHGQYGDTVGDIVARCIDGYEELIRQQQGQGVQSTK